MSQRISSGRGRQKSKRSTTWLWIIGMSLVVFLLIYFEQTAILYVLATLSLTVLLVIVAFADLRDAPTAAELPRPSDDAAAIGTGIGSIMPPASVGAAPPRPSRPARRK